MELAGSIADLIGAFKGARTTFYEKAIYKSPFGNSRMSDSAQ